MDTAYDGEPFPNTWLVDGPWSLIQTDPATYKTLLEGKPVDYIRYCGTGSGSWQVVQFADSKGVSVKSFATPEEAHKYIVDTFE